MATALPNHARLARAAEWLGVVVLFLLLSLWYTDPLWRHPATNFVDPSDPLHNVCVSWWLSRLFLSGHLAGMWEVPPYFYPARLPLALDDPQIGVSLLGLPFLRATGSIVVAYNAVVLLSVPLCGLGACALARHVTGSRAGALVAGIAWGFGAWHSGQAGHQQILSLECLPWVLLALHRYGETGRARWLIGVFALWTAQEYLCEYWGAFLYLLIVPFAVVLLRVCHGLSWRATARGLCPVALAALAWLPALWPYLLLAWHGQGHPAGMINQFSADLADYLPQTGTWLWGQWGYGSGGEAAVSPGLIVLAAAAGMTARQLRVTDRPETLPSARAERAWAWGAARAPLLLLLLLIMAALMRLLGVWDLQSFHLPRAVVNLDSVTRAFLLVLLLWCNAPLRAWARRHAVGLRDRRSPLLPYALLALLAAVWSCGYQVHAGDVWLAPGIHGLVAWLPGVRSFRVLMRMGVFADLALAVLAAAGAAAGARRWRARGGPAWQRGLAAAALGLLILADNVPRDGTTFAHSHACLPRARPVDAWLAAQPPGPLLELPFLPSDAARMWDQTRHRKPMVNGYATFAPPGYAAEMQLLAAPQAPAAVARLRALGVRYVVLDRVGQPPTALPPPYRLRYADPAAVVYTLGPAGP